MRLNTIATIIGLSALLPMSASATCTFSQDAENAIRAQPLLSELISVHANLFPNRQTDCEFEQGISNLVDQAMAQNIPPTDLMATCSIYHDIAESTVDEINILLEMECLDMDCTAQDKKLSSLGFLTNVDGTYFFQKEASASESMMITDNRLTITQHNWKAATPFEDCGKMDISLIDIKGDNSRLTNNIRSALNEGLEPFVVSLRDGRMSPHDAFNQLRMDNQFHYTLKQFPVMKTNGLMTVKTEFGNFTGGAHGMSTDGYVNIDIFTGQMLFLEDVFEQSSVPTLLNLLEQALRDWASTNTGQSGNGDLKQLGFIFDSNYIPEGASAWSRGDGLYISDNFYVSNEGINFVYNPYEIGPKAFGIIDIVIKWPDIDPLLKKGSPIDQMLNE